MPKIPNYPLRFTPIFKERIWGGELHRQWLGAQAPEGMKVGESWEICDRAEENSVVANGPLAGMTLRALIEQFPQALLGPEGQPGQRFPLLIKFIGVVTKVSIQVHPTDTYARKHHSDDCGKTEMWYILEADPASELFMGFRGPQTRDAVHAAILADRLEPLINRVDVKPDDAFFIPPGRIHGLGGGILMAEIQDNSDLTYRVYDYGRKDANGSPRPLHIHSALDVIDFSDTSQGRLSREEHRDGNARVRPLIYNDHFHSEHIIYEKSGPGPERPGFQILIVTQGQGRLLHAQGAEPLLRGSVILLPAGFSSWQVEPAAPGLGILQTWVEA